MRTANYTDRKSFTKYNDEQHLLYLNEKTVSFTPAEGQDEVAGYSYTGDMEDGSTIIEARNITDENRRDRYIAGLIGKRYSIDDQIALLANGSNTPQHAQELKDFEAYRTECKKLVDELLNR